MEKLDDNETDEGLRSITRTRVLSAPYLIFYVMRNIGPALERDTTELQDDPEIRDTTELQVDPEIGGLRLLGIVIYEGDPHFTCVFCNRSGTWYHYDDTKPRLSRIGSLEELNQWREGKIKRDGVLYFYGNF